MFHLIKSKFSQSFFVYDGDILVQIIEYDNLQDLANKLDKYYSHILIKKN